MALRTSGSDDQGDAADLVDLAIVDGDDAGPGAVRGGPRWRRRRRVLTAVGVVAAVGVGAALVAPNGDEAAVPTVTSFPTSGTTGGTTTTAPAGPSATGSAVGYVLDPAVAAAAGFVPVGGLSPSTPPPEPAGRMRLWATQGASRTSGTWLAIQWSDEPAPAAAQDAARVAVGGGSDSGGTAGVDALVVVEPDGVVSLTEPTPAGGSVMLTSYGIGPTDLVGLAATLRSTAPAREAGVLSAQPYGGAGPLRLLLDRPSTARGLGDDLLTVGLEATAFYRDDAGRIVSVTTSPLDRERESVLAPFVLRGLGADGTRARIVAHGDVGLSDHPALGALHVVTFTEHTRTVRVSSTRADVDLVGLAGAAVVGDEDAWDDVQARGGGFVDGRGIPYVSAGTGTFADGASWTLSLASGPLWGSFFVAEGDGTGTVAELYLDRSPCASVTTRSATTVACVRPTTDIETQLLVGEAVESVPFEATGSGWSIAVVRVAEIGPLSLVETGDGRSVTLGRTGGDADGWARWATFDPIAEDQSGGADAVDDTGWVVDGGIPGLAPIGLTTGQGAEPAGTLAIWGTPDATRATGTWVAIATARGEFGPAAAEDAVRVRMEDPDGNEIRALLQTSPDGVSSLRWTTVDGGAATAVARGIDLDRLFALAAGLQIGDDPTTGLATPLLAVAPTADDGTPLAELSRQPTSGLAPGYLGLDLGTRWTVFVDDVGAFQAEIAVDEVSAVDDVAARLLLGPSPAADPPVDLAAVRATLGAGVLIGTIPGEPAMRVLRARLGDTVVTIVSRLPLTTVEAALGGLRPATADEWSDLLAAGSAWLSSVSVEPSTIGGGFTGDGSQWSSAMQDMLGIVSAQDTSGAWSLALEPSTDQPIHIVRTIDRTFVVAVLPAPGAATALQVTTGGAAPVLVPLSPSASGLSSWVGAAYAVDAADEATIRVELV